MSQLTVPCPLCGERLPQLNREHALAHGYKSLAEFKEAAGITYTTLQQRSRGKIQQLYNIDRARWGTVIWTAGGEWRYVTKRYYGADYEEAKAKGVRSANRFPLCDAQFNRHFTGPNPLAIFAYGTHSRYFGFDIDSKELAPAHTLRIVRELKAEGIPAEAIHVSFSGGKGYHVELFIDKHVQHEHWAAFGDYIIDAAGLTGEAIEYRPNKGNSHAWKLPLTWHHSTGKFAGFCDRETLERYDVVSSHDYLFGITQTSSQIIFPVISRARAMETEVKRRQDVATGQRRLERKRQREAVKITDARLFRTDDEKKTSAIKYLTLGLVAPGSRWNATRDVALYLFHESGNDPQTIRQQLIEWTVAQIDRGMITTPLDQCEREIDEMIAWVATTSGLYSTVREIQITRAEIDHVLSIKDRLPRDLFWALLLRSKAYNYRESFYTSDRDVQKLISKPRPMSRGAISKWRTWLVDHEYITADIPKPSKHNRLATTYRILFEEDGEPEIIDSLPFDDSLDCRELLRSIAGRFYGDKELKKLKLA